MAVVSDLVAPLQLMCRSVGPAQAQLALVESMKTFMLETEIFTDTLQIPYQTGVCEYWLDIPADQLISSIINVSVNGESTTRWARDGQYNVVQLFDDYHEGACVLVHYSWAITGIDNCQIPTEFLTRFRMPILDGARQYLHSMYGSQMVDYVVAQLAARQFHDAIADTKASRIMNFSNSRPKMHSGKVRRRTRASARRLL
ncbi:hypothetical protein [Xenorhabdus sp. KK7.4]|uniref:hypothetical protein n=1 Tax=Xenorhabdus sp. KK7.4 TaxID=1851572 RepID=UPI000C03D09C|nr:hypothetical protein [Xenorhabdus sp. KK7.4]PHM52098.1 hypothetical protein Xekk_03323 [Xenorhabdus sp. KK7.4]